MSCPNRGGDTPEAEFCDMHGVPPKGPIAQSNLPSAPGDLPNPKAGHGEHLEGTTGDDGGADEAVPPRRGMSKKLKRVIAGVAAGALVVVLGLGVLASHQQDLVQKRQAQAAQEVQAAQDAQEKWDELPTQTAYLNLASLVKGKATIEESGLQKRTVTIAGKEIVYYLPNARILAAKSGVDDANEAEATAQAYYGAANALINALLDHYGTSTDRFVSLDGLLDRGLTQEQLDTMEDIPLYICFSTSVEKTNGGTYPELSNAAYVMVSDESASAASDILSAVELDALLPVVTTEASDAPILVGYDGDPYISARGTTGLMYQDTSACAMGYRKYVSTDSYDGLSIRTMYCVGTFDLISINDEFSKSLTLNKRDNLFEGTIADIVTEDTES